MRATTDICPAATKSVPSARRGRAIFILVLVAALAACGSTTPDRAGLQTLQALKATADAAMRTCASAYAAGQLTEQQKAQAIAAYDAFASAEITAAFALKGATTDQEVAALTANVSHTLFKLTDLLQSFGLKVVSQ